MPPRYDLIDHTADLGAWFYGDDLQDLFANAGLALFHLMLESPPSSGTETATIEVEGVDLEDLLINWLSELLYHFDARQKVAVDIRVGALTDHALTALVTWADFDSTQGLDHEIKAVTYHQVAVTPDNGGFKARVIFDL